MIDWDAKCNEIAVGAIDVCEKLHGKSLKSGFSRGMWPLYRRWLGLEDESVKSIIDSANVIIDIRRFQQGEFICQDHRPSPLRSRRSD